MNVKEWLNRGHKLNEKINDLIDQQADAFAKACKVTPILVQDKVQACGGKSREDWIIKRIEYEDEINSKIDELYKLRCERFRVISKVGNDTYRKLLTMRYVDFKKWSEIAEEINRPESTTKGRIHSRALQEITQYIV